VSASAGDVATVPGGLGAAAAPALSVQNLHVSLAGSHVLQGVSFDVPPGAVTALLGRNGVGKTTTLRAVLALVASAGKVEVLGHDVSGWPTHRIVQLGIGYVPEDRDVFSGLSVEENLRLAARLPGARYDEVHELFPELRQRARQRAGTLSGGQQQMLALARVLLYRQPLLLVDEPTKGLAPRLVDEVVDVLGRAAAESSLLLVEQNVHVVRRLAERFVVLDHGKVVHAGESAQLADEGLVRHLLGVSG
jgi:branched-chain amino acid transport system ATP-binding protein